MKKYLFGAAIAACVCACSGKIVDDGGSSKGPLGGEGKAAEGGGGGDPESGFAEAEPAQPTPAPDSPGGSPSPGGCFTVAAGSICSDPKGKDMAVAICKSKGFALTAVIADPWKGCTITCCSSGPVPPPPPPPPPPLCTWQVLGDGVSCISYLDLKEKAWAICAAQNADVRGIYPSNDCAGGTKTAKLECCEPGPNVPTPPPPPKK